MSSRHHIDDFMRGRIIGKIEEGRKITDVAREFDIAHSVVSWLWKSFKTTGMCSRRHGGGRVRSTTPAEDRYIVLSAKRNRRTTAQQVANQFLAASGKQIPRKTVAGRLRGGGLYTRRPVVCVPLTRQHRTARLQWCREHHIWTEQDWACVLFSDESRDLELEVNEDDIELIMGHEDELTMEELKAILNEEHQETQRNVSSSEQEEVERVPMPTSAIKDLFKKWDAVRAMVLE
ncbi:transposable element Tcb1 transposase [Trichonephila clavipes]|uniref:Transposable element Tcb1 transposase n=1 Tax=Trichonephila clavipes TaxID=2585209 RepID=A0A8X6VF78_TRICX|nr:transposable element Tcb1 transposase [Trichonephila clavipes]